jgi:hypothetical protein
VNDRGLSGPSAEAEHSTARRGSSALQRHLRSRLRSMPGAGMPGMGLMPAPSPRSAPDPAIDRTGPGTIAASGPGSRAPSEDRQRSARHRPGSEPRQRREGGRLACGGVAVDQRPAASALTGVRFEPGSPRHRRCGAFTPPPGTRRRSGVESPRVIRIQNRQGRNAPAPSSRTDRSSGAGSARPYPYVMQRPARTGAS